MTLNTFPTQFTPARSTQARSTQARSAQRRIAALTALGVAASSFLPWFLVSPAQAQSRFTDVPGGYWAERFIVDLASRDVIAGFPDGSFRPNAPVTRAQYAAMVRKAFNKAQLRSPIAFVDVPGSYWATPAINQAYSMGFMSGYPGNVFRPEQNIPRTQVLVSLANGLNYAAQNTASVNVYSDASLIPSYAISSVAAATERRLVVNYPNVQVLNPNQNATRADVAAFIYQALASQGQVAQVNSPYVVGQGIPPTPTTPTKPTALPLVSGTVIPTTYPDTEKILLLPDETLPLTLTVQQPLTSAGYTLVPAGSQVVGELRPSNGGSQFVAQELVLLSGQRFPLNAASGVVTRKETIRKEINGGRAAIGGAIGAGAAAAIATITGDRIDAWEVLAGSAAGTVAGIFLGKEKVEVIAVDPVTDLALTLNGNLQLPVP
ncbi:MAG: S-layer homology domain-containing protein [Prochlorothrix sp.]|nr:S-layer homology domain-containing protein [Prochlorothrix sp.]